ncbi:MAG: DNA internalization-related competence protein ComEC/Rec2 [Gemmatimonadetes bacterium]|nr:DNA internalization-related competence protein ComEC/Rec2 [Gemmatimonadota bacterium]
MNPTLRPLVAATLALLLGLLPALRFAPPPPALLALTAVTILWAAVTHRDSSPSGASPFPLLLCFASLGGLLGAAAVRQASEDCRNGIPDGTRVNVSGVLGAASRVEGEASSPLVPLEYATVEAGGAVCMRPVRARLPLGAPLAAGAEIRGAGEWRRSPLPVVPSGWPADPMFSGTVTLDTLLGTTPPSVLRHPLLFARGRTEARLQRLFPHHFGLAEALLLGRRERMDSAVRERFVRAGLVHLLAISGAHVALFAAMLLLVGDAMRLPRERVRAGTIGVTALYLALIGAPGSAVRAGIMLSLALLARIIQRPSATMPIVAASALALIAWDPRTVLDPGVQLSFAGVGALMLAARVDLDAMPRHLARGPGRYVTEAVIVSVVAFALTAPVTAYHFGAVSPIAIAANLPAVPLTSLALVGVVTALVVDPVFSPVAGLIADGAAVSLDAVDRVARVAGEVPFGYLHLARPEWGLWCALALATLVGLRATMRLSKGVGWAVAAGLVLSVGLAWPAVGTARSDALEIHFVDVGQGDAVAIRTPGARWLLIDTGPRDERFDAGARRVLPFLSAHGASRVDALILTHPHADHIGGAPAIVEGVAVGRVIEPGLAVGTDLYLELLSLIEKREIPWARAEAGRRLSVDGVELRFLWPDPGLVDTGAEPNDASAVVHLRYGSFAALLTGDAPAEVEQELVRREGTALRADILKAGHHGSSTSTSAELLAAVQPELAVISAGRRNRYGHPSPEVVSRLQARGIEIARTDLEGSVSVRVSAGDGYGWRRLSP